MPIYLYSKKGSAKIKDDIRVFFAISGLQFVFHINRKFKKMVGVQTFWLKEVDDSWQFWRSKQNLMVSCSLSYYLLKKHFKTVNLVCNEFGKDFMTKELGLQFDQIDIIPFEETELNEFVWSIFKLYSYSIQNKPFVHIDTDFFMFQKPPKEYLEAEVFAQNIEINHPIYDTIRTKAIALGLKLPEHIIASQKPAVALNVGIVGGHNLKFFKEFYILAKKILEENSTLLERHAEELYFFYLFLEQHILFEALNKQEIEIRTLIKPSFKVAYDHITSFKSGENKRPFVHLMGNFKENPESIHLMHQELKNLWPLQYDFIIGN